MGPFFNSSVRAVQWLELRSCVKVEVAAVLGFPPLTVLTVSVDVKQH